MHWIWIVEISIPKCFALLLPAAIQSFSNKRSFIVIVCMAFVRMFFSCASSLYASLSILSGRWNVYTNNDSIHGKKIYILNNVVAAHNRKLFWLCDETTSKADTFREWPFEISSRSKIKCIVFPFNVNVFALNTPGERNNDAAADVCWQKCGNAIKWNEVKSKHEPKDRKKESNLLNFT